MTDYNPASGIKTNHNTLCFLNILHFSPAYELQYLMHVWQENVHFYCANVLSLSLY